MSRQTYVCRDNCLFCFVFVATSILLSWQKTCFVATNIFLSPPKIILVAGSPPPMTDLHSSATFGPGGGWREEIRLNTRASSPDDQQHPIPTPNGWDQAGVSVVIIAPAPSPTARVHSTHPFCDTSPGHRKQTPFKRHTKPGLIT